MIHLANFTPKLTHLMYEDLEPLFIMGRMIKKRLVEDIQPIMFLSKCLSGPKKEYWPTELETAGLVWLMQRIPHMVIASNVRHHKPQITIYTEHSATTSIVKQTKLASTSRDN